MSTAPDQDTNTRPNPFAESNQPEGGSPDALRAAMIDELWRTNAIRSDRVAAAFAQADRHVFAPGVPLQEVYAPTTAVKTKYDER